MGFLGTLHKKSLISKVESAIIYIGVILGHGFRFLSTRFHWQPSPHELVLWSGPFLALALRRCGIGKYWIWGGIAMAEETARRFSASTAEEHASKFSSAFAFAGAVYVACASISRHLCKNATACS